MTTDVLTEEILEQAETIVEAEWLRLHQDNVAPVDAHRPISQMPAARSRPVTTITSTATDARPEYSPLPSRPQWPPTSGSLQRVWPTQRSPPRHRGAASNHTKPGR
jgi:hypothetical protein